MTDIKKISSEDLLQELIDREVLEKHTYFTVNERSKEISNLLKNIEKYVVEVMDKEINL
ncbi:hypothetical protein [Lactobacillus intestinalis]|uniref:hypothetical protein n=1 Tax=Lactobacillus intestinalis TaxID=151781 RepID=UPI0032B1C8CE